MEGSKDFFMSKRTWGAIILLIAPLLRALDIEIADQQALVDAILTLIGTVTFIIGQFKASKRIGSIAGIKLKRSDFGVFLPLLLAGSLALALSGCASTGKQIGNARLVLAAQAQQIGTAAERADITAAELDTLQSQLDKVKRQRGYLNDAMGLARAGEKARAKGLLEAAQAVIDEVENLLKRYQARPN